MLTVLGEAGLGVENLGSHRPALTVIICDIHAEERRLEIEAIAAA